MSNININELSLENIGQWPPIIKITVVAFFSLLIVVIGYMLLAKPHFDEYAFLQTQEADLKTKFETKQHQASNLQGYRDQVQQMQERFGSMLRQLPTENEMPALLDDISKTGVASGLTFESFTPLPEVVHDFYIEVPIKISVVGSYHQLAVFLSRVVQMGRIVTLHDFVIQRASKDDKPIASGDSLVMQMTAKIYRYRTQS